MNDSKSININGYDTYYIEAEDDIGKHFLIYIPKNADKDISDIRNTLSMVTSSNKLITRKLTEKYLLSRHTIDRPFINYF